MMIPNDNIALWFAVGLLIGLMVMCLFEVVDKVIGFSEWRKFKRRIKEIESGEM